VKLYGGIDLHSNNSVVALTDEADRIVYRKRLPNDVETILDALAPYQDAITGLVVESTYNWYWLVDALMEAGYQVHLANTAAIVQYSGLKYSDDDTDAAWLGKLLRLGLLPEGYIYPKAERAVRDLLRRRLHPPSASGAAAHREHPGRAEPVCAQPRALHQCPDARRLTPESVAELVTDPNLALAIQSTVLTMRGQQAAIGLLEREAPLQDWAANQGHAGLASAANGQRHRAHPRAHDRAGDRPHRALRSGRQLCLLLPLRRQHARLQRQAEGQGQHQERQQVPGVGLCGGGQFRRALRPADQALLSTQARQSQDRRGHQGGRAQAGTRLLPHAARRQHVRREPRLRVNRIGHAAVSLAMGLATNHQI